MYKYKTGGSTRHEYSKSKFDWCGSLSVSWVDVEVSLFLTVSWVHVSNELVDRIASALEVHHAEVVKPCKRCIDNWWESEDARLCINMNSFMNEKYMRNIAYLKYEALKRLTGGWGQSPLSALTPRGHKQDLASFEYWRSIHPISKSSACENRLICS